MFKILQARLQQHVNWELTYIKAGFRKVRGTRDQMANIHWIIEKAKAFWKNIHFFFIDYAKVFVWITTNCGQFLKIWEYQTILPASWETCMQVQKKWSQTWNNDWFKIGKGVWQGSILSPCLFNLYAEYIIRNAKLDEAQTEIEIARRNINNLRYADDTNHMVESKEQIKILLRKVKAGLKFNFQNLRFWHPVSWLHGK